jgi:hypothetical protein
MKVTLYAPPSYWALTEKQLKELIGTGGCGPGKFGDYLVPDTWWGLNIKMVCTIHDYMYKIGETVEDKAEADRVFLNNMLRLIDAQGSMWLIRRLRTSRAMKYYNAVRDFGGPSFWKWKNDPAAMRMVTA